ncbi:MAG: hypothetical protein ACO4CG_12520 [Prochlorothrix sp.]
MNLFSAISAGLTLTQLLLQLTEKQESPVLLDYGANSSPNTDQWRWRRPDRSVDMGDWNDRGLQLLDTATGSHLRFPKRLVLAELLIQLLGYGVLGLILFLGLGLGLGVLRDPTTWLETGAIFALFGAIGVWCVRCSHQVTRIDLYPDRADLVVKYGFWFQRKYRLQPHPRLKFNALKQTWRTRDLRRNRPCCEILVEQSFLPVISLNRKFSLACGPAQGSWIVGGLNYWNTVHFD